jgi:hypothetical protein
MAIERILLTAITTAAVLLALASPAFGFTFNEPGVRATGPEETVFDWSEKACEEIDIPDTPARAFRDSSGRVQLIDSHYVTRRNIGTTLGSVTHDCSILMASNVDQDPSHYDDHVWMGAPYTLDGQTVYALVSNELQGWRYPTCPVGDTWAEQQTCWENSITSAVSTDKGDHYAHAAVPQQLVAAAPYQYTAGSGPYGYFAPSNIVHRQQDDYYYALIRAEHIGDQQVGACLIRTRTLGDPASWRAWDGGDFNVSFINPYVATGEAASAHVCTPVATPQIAKMTSSLTYSTYFGKFILVGQLAPKNPVTQEVIPGFYYSLSDDLIHWSPAKLLVQAELDWTFQCGDQGPPIRDPSLLDPGSSSQNFEVVGQHPYLYFTRFNYDFWDNGECAQSLDRDLIRIPIEFSDASGTPDPDPTPPASPPPPAPANTAPAVVQAPVAAAGCSTALSKRKRLVRLIRKTRHKLARAKTRRAKRHYRKLLKKQKKSLAQASYAVNVKCGRIP